MADVSLLLMAPLSPCGESEQQCPLMRLCPCCGFTFVNARNRRQHENHCKGAVDVPVVEAQHEHLVNVHRIRRRTRGRARG